MLARALYTYDVHIRLSTLSKILHDKDALSFRKGFDIGSIVAAAYVYWEQRDLRTARAIAAAFRSEEGHPIIAANEPPVLLRESQEA